MVYGVQSLARNIQAQFNEIYRSIWQRTGGKPCIGVAVSGGVDSMALVSLCTSARAIDASFPRITAFVVDHGIRQGSQAEAEAVAAQLEKSKVEARILALPDLERQNVDLSRIEGVARTLRYQALGRACVEHDIGCLLTGHHADDQAETVLQRLLMKYYGSGLKGMQEVAKIPECDGIYGVDESGGSNSFVGSTARAKTNMSIAGGGVLLGRPLLRFSKSSLLRLCQDRKIAWVEDPTNADSTYTLRNTIRYLQTKDDLPMAMNTTRLCALAESRGVAQRSVDAKVDKILQLSNLKLDLRCDRLSFNVSQSMRRYESEAALAIHAGMVKSLCEVLDPSISLDTHGSIHAAVDMIFHADTTEKAVALGKLRLQRSSGDDFTLERTPPHDRDPARVAHELPLKRCRVAENPWLRAWLHHGESNEESKDRRLPLGHIWMSDWHLWDNRYWIRVLNLAEEPPEESLYVRSLTEADIQGLRQKYVRLPPSVVARIGNKMERSLKKKGKLDAAQLEWIARSPEKRRSDAVVAKMLDKALKKAPGELRFTIPAIVRGGEQDAEVVALPSLGWSVAKVGATTQGDDRTGVGGTLRWQLLHRRIELMQKGSSRHKLIASGEV